MFVIWTFVGMQKEEKLYQRSQNLPVKNKVVFVNYLVDYVKYPSFVYIKGFANQIGLGLISQFMNLKDKGSYD